MMMTRRPARALLPTLFVFVTACGSAQPAPTTPPPVANTHPPGNSSDHASGGIVIEGQLGFLTQEQLTGVLTPATAQIAGCYNDRLSERPFLAGRIDLKIRIGADGAPLWTIPLHSTIGDRPTEQCMIERVMALRFPRPRGGETETTFPLTFEGGEDARPAVDWQPSRVTRVVDQHRAALTNCTHGMPGPFEITLYAAPHGRVATAGVGIGTSAAASAVDCLVREVTSWHVPDPGSWYAKTTIQFEIQQ